MRKRRVALVGLPPDTSTTLCRALDPRRYDVDQFGTPVSFLHVLGNLRATPPGWSPTYDLVLCRLDMPGISGVGLLLQVRLADPKITVVVSCPTVDDELVSDLQTLGAAVAQEPIEPEVFRSLLERVLVLTARAD